MFHDILIPTDGSAAATHALTSFAALAASTPDIHVTLLVAIAPRKPEQSDESETWLKRENARMRTAAQETLDEAASLFASAGITALTVIAEGHPASAAIIEECNRNHYDLLVMASRGLGADRSEKDYIGSVTENVLRKSRIPALIFPIHSDGRLHLIQGATE